MPIFQANINCQWKLKAKYMKPTYLTVRHFEFKAYKQQKSGTYFLCIFRIDLTNEKECKT